jgi:hypothetical protein
MNEHSITVWKVMQQMALEKTWNQDYANDMFILWYLHDIGKQFGYMADHAEKWWEILKRSDYKYRQEIYYHWSVGCEYQSEELDLLNTADLQVLQDWKQVTVKERLDDIWLRYGVDSNTYKDCKQLAINLNLL